MYSGLFFIKLCKNNLRIIHILAPVCYKFDTGVCHLAWYKFVSIVNYNRSGCGSGGLTEPRGG